MASFGCKLDGYPVCDFGIAKRGTKESDEQNTGVLTIAAVAVTVIALCVAGVIAWKICRRSPKTPNNNDIELAVVPQRTGPEPAVPQPVAVPGRRESICPAPPPYRATSFNCSHQYPAPDEMETVDLKK